jgi:hypothetical protein
MKVLDRRWRTTAWLVLTSSIMLGAAAAAEEEQEPPLGLHDFAHGRRIEIASPGALHALLLDRWVHAGSVEGRLDDLRVFNGAGEAVPHATRSLSSTDSLSKRRAQLPLFRLDAAQAESRTRITPPGPGLYEIDAEIAASGAIVRVRPVGGEASVEPSEATPDDPQIWGYLLDASQLDRSVVALELELAPDATDFVTRVRVEGSNDLARFHPLTRHAAVARLAQSGHRIERTRIELSTTRDDYIRISWAEGQPPLAIRSVRAELEALPVPPPRHHAQVVGLPMPGEPRSYLFFVGGALPVDRVQVVPPQQNSLAEIEIFSGQGKRGPWIRRQKSLVYQLEASDGSGEVLRNPPISWPVTRDRYFKLVVSPKGGGLGAGAPVLDVAWRPEQLLFVGRGSGPYTLAYGRLGAPRASFGATELLTSTLIRPHELPTTTAHLGPPLRLGSDILTRQKVEPLSKKTVALWAVLVTIVFVVGMLSFRLLREMRDAWRG